MAEAAEAREREVVAATKPAIEKHRKAEAKIRAVDAEGRPVPDVRLTVEQTGHDFLFGADIFGFDRYRTEAQNATYKKRFEELPTRLQPQQIDEIIREVRRRLTNLGR